MIDTMAAAMVMNTVLDLNLQDRALIRELFLADESFRSACEDYALSNRMLSKFEAVTDGSRDIEIADYRSLRAALFEELKTIINRSQGCSKLFQVGEAVPRE